MIRSSVACFAALSAAVSSAHAETPAERYLHQSTSLSGQLSAGAQSNPLGASAVVSLGLSVRQVWRGWSFGASATGFAVGARFQSAADGAPGGSVNLELGASLGYGFAAGDRVVLNPEVVVAASASAFTTNRAVLGPPPRLAWGAQLPVTVLVSEHFFVEPYLSVLAAEHFWEDGSPSTSSLQFVLGQRFGFCF